MAGGNFNEIVYRQDGKQITIGQAFISPQGVCVSLYKDWLDIYDAGKRIPIGHIHEGEVRYKDVFIIAKRDEYQDSLYFAIWSQYWKYKRWDAFKIWLIKTLLKLTNQTIYYPEIPEYPYTKRNAGKPFGIIGIAGSAYQGGEPCETHIHYNYHPINHYQIDQCKEVLSEACVHGMGVPDLLTNIQMEPEEGEETPYCQRKFSKSRSEPAKTHTCQYMHHNVPCPRCGKPGCDIPIGEDRCSECWWITGRHASPSRA